MYDLSKGSLKQILEGVNVSDPVMQILQIKNIQNSNVDAMTRYKITLFDGDMQHTFGILATQKNHTVENEELKIGSVVKLTEYAANVLSKEPQKVVIILMNFTILGEMDPNTAEKRSNNENHEPVKKQNSPVKPQQQQQQASATVPASKFFKQESLKQPNKMNSPVLANKNNTTLNTTAGGGSDKGTFNGFKIFTIASLNPYQNKWSIKARVTNKTAIRTWSNSRGEGKLFSVDLIDQTGEIKANVFTDACDRLHDLLQVDHVYYISKAQLKPANKQYTTNDYEMTLNNDTMIELCEEENDNSIPHINVSLIPIADLVHKNANDIVDIIGVVRSATDVNSFIAKTTNKELKKREIHLADSSGCSVSCTLWGKTAEEFDASENPVLLLKGAKVSDFNGRTLSALMSTIMQINPDIPEAHTLRGWFDQGGCDNGLQDLSSGGAGAGGMSGGGAGGMTQSNWKTLDQVRDEQLGMGDKADYFTTTATVTFTKKENALYLACPSENCNKKVIDQNNGYYRCEKCGKDFDTFKWRMILSLSIADHSESEWITCFQESGETILDIKTSDLGELKSRNDPSFDEAFANAVFKQFTFKLRAKMETYNDERRIKLSVVNVEPMDYVANGKRLLQKIKIFANSQN